MRDLRPWQVEAIDRVRARWGMGQNVLIGQAATGLGKTVMFCHLLKAELDGTQGRALILAHREELLQQPIGALAEEWPEGSRGLARGKTRQYDRQVIVGSIASLGPTHYGEIPALTHVIIDEAHHAQTDNTYGKLLSYLQWRNPSLKVLGVTATAFRGDGKGLGAIFPPDCDAFSFPVLYGIEQGHLCPIRGMKIETGVNLGGLHSRHGDFATDELADATNTPARNDVIVRAYMEHAWIERRPTIAFTVNVQHAQDLAESFRKNGVAAEAVWGSMPQKDRADVLDRFRRFEVGVVTNCGVLTEGWDSPKLSCILLARPTKSPVLYMQMVGRGLRTRAGKTDCLIVDFVDIHKTIDGLQSMIDLSIPDLGTPLEGKRKGRPKEVLPVLPVDEFGRIDWRGVEYDLFTGKVEWEQLFGARILSIGKGRILCFYPEHGGWRALLADVKARRTEFLCGEVPTPAAARAVAEACLRRCEVDAGLVRRSVWWERQGIAIHQIHLLRSHGFTDGQVTGWSRGYARTILDWAQLRREYVRTMRGTLQGLSPAADDFVARRILPGIETAPIPWLNRHRAAPTDPNEIEKLFGRYA